MTTLKLFRPEGRGANDAAANNSEGRIGKRQHILSIVDQMRPCLNIHEYLRRFSFENPSSTDLS